MARPPNSRSLGSPYSERGSPEEAVEGDETRPTSGFGTKGETVSGKGGLSRRSGSLP